METILTKQNSEVNIIETQENYFRKSCRLLNIRINERQNYNYDTAEMTCILVSPRKTFIKCKFLLQTACKTDFFSVIKICGAGIKSLSVIIKYIQAHNSWKSESTLYIKIKDFFIHIVLILFSRYLTVYIAVRKQFILLRNICWQFDEISSIITIAYPIFQTSINHNPQRVTILKNHHETLNTAVLKTLLHRHSVDIVTPTDKRKPTPLFTLLEKSCKEIELEARC